MRHVGRGGGGEDDNGEEGSVGGGVDGGSDSQTDAVGVTILLQRVCATDVESLESFGRLMSPSRRDPTG